MARLRSSGFELNTTTAGVEVDFTNTGATIVTSPARTGTYALRVNSSASIVRAGFQFAVIGSAPTVSYYRCYVNMASVPAAKTRLMYTSNDTDGQFGIRINTDGTLGLYSENGGGVQQGSDSSTVLSTATWYRLELSVDMTTTSSSVGIAYINGVQFATGTVNLTSVGKPIYFAMGDYASSTCDRSYDDVAVNDNSGSNQNGLPGAGQIVHLRPNATGDNNAFTVQVGGTAGAANNYTRVKEVTPDDITSYNGDVLSGNIDDFNIDDTPGSIGSSDTINVVQVGVRYRAAVAASEAAFKIRIKKAASGTVSSSAAITPTATSWASNANAVPRNYPLTLYQDPDSSNWSKATLDTTQIGYTISTTNTNAADISTLWLLVDSTPAGGTLHTSSVSGTYSTTGSIAKLTNKGQSASYSNSGAVTKTTNRLFSPSYSTNGVFTKVTNKTFSGISYMTSGILSSTHQHFKSLTATFSATGAITNRIIARTFTATYSTSGLMIRSIGRIFTATYKGTGNLINRVVTHSLVAVYSTTGSLNRVNSRILGAIYSTSGSLTKTISRSISAMYQGSGLLSRKIMRSFIASFNGSGLLNGRLNRPLSGNYSASGSLNHRNGKIFTAIYQTSGSLVRSVLKTLTAMFSYNGSLSRNNSKYISAIYSDSGLVQRQINRQFTANDIKSGSLLRQASKTLVAIYIVSGSLGRMIGRSVYATFTASGLLTKSANKIVRFIQTFLGQKPNDARISSIGNTPVIESVDNSTRISTVSDNPVIGNNKE